MKKLSKVLVLLTLVICLSGCMKINIVVDVKSTTEMTMNMDYMFSEESLKSLGVTKEQMIEQLQKSMKTSSPDAKVTPKDEKIDGKNWVGLNISASINKTEIKKVLSEKEIDGKKSLVLTLGKDFMSSSQFGGMSPNSITEQSGASISELQAEGVEMNIVINMPADAKSNFGKVDGHQVTIDLLELSVKGSAIQKIEISSALSSGFDMNYLLVAGAIIVIIGIVFVMMKKKKKPEFIEITNTEEVIQPHDTTTETTPEEQIIVEVVEETPEADEHPIQEVVSKTEMTPTETYCPNCGGHVGTNDVFCQKCGFNLKK